jgi:hypothetical protein
MIVETILINLIGFLLWYIVVLIREVNHEFFVIETDSDRLERKEANRAYYDALLTLVKIQREELETR